MFIILTKALISPTFWLIFAPVFVHEVFGGGLSLYLCVKYLYILHRHKIETKHIKSILLSCLSLILPNLENVLYCRDFVVKYQYQKEFYLSITDSFEMMVF